VCLGAAKAHLDVADVEHHGATEGRLTNLGDGAAVAETEHVKAATDVIGTLDGDVFNGRVLPCRQ
ncbi:hypothetical protein Q0P08_15200, partial [Staphylococcus aureus]|nr:hypothetical protein [Staphylococcus aureus]